MANETAEDVLLPITINERQVLLDAADSLDVKGGVLMGFASVVFGFTTNFERDWMQLVTGLLALACVALAVSSMRVQAFPALEPVPLRDKYVNATAREVQSVVLSAFVSQHPQLQATVKRKAWLTGLATWVLALEILVFFMFALAASLGE